MGIEGGFLQSLLFMQTIPCVCDMLKMGSAIREFFYLEVYGTVAVCNAEGYKNSHAKEKTE